MSSRVTITKQQVIDQLHRLGVRDGMVLVVHTSFRAVGPVEDGPQGLIDALQTALGPQGTLVMPTMTGSRRPEPYEPERTPTRNMGIVAETFWRLPGVLRSDHPTSSCAAAGPQAAFITAPQPLAPAHGLDSPIGRVHELDGCVLLLGVDHTANTTIHLAESMGGVPYRIPKWCTVLEHGLPRRVSYEEIDHCGRNFQLVDGWLRDEGLQVEGAVGHAVARLARSRDIVTVALERLRADPTCFLCARDTGCSECDEAWRSVPATDSQALQ
jgi:aminoglycoside 3-N-acetyltransferase